MAGSLVKTLPVILATKPDFLALVHEPHFSTLVAGDHAGIELVGICLLILLAMVDGFKTPGQPDGMAAFPADCGKIVLVCNHELALKSAKEGPFPDNSQLPHDFDAGLSYDGEPGGKQPHVGGTTNIVFDPKSGKTVSQFLSLTGTNRNCAGGAMPWGSWITCEELDHL